MGWRRSPAFFALWLLILLFLAVHALLVESHSLGYPALETLAALHSILLIFMIPLVVVALACLSRPINGEPLAALLLAFPTYLLSIGLYFPVACVFRGCSRPGSALYGALGLSFSVLWAMGASVLASAEEPSDWKAALGIFLLFVGWIFPYGLLFLSY